MPNVAPVNIPLIMKRIVILAILLLCAATLQAQGDKFKAFGQKYEKCEGYEVATVGRTGIRLAAMAGDKESREMMRKIDLLVVVSCNAPEDEVLKADFDSLVDGYTLVNDYQSDGNRAWVYINGKNTAFAMYMSTPKTQQVMLLTGRELDLHELLPPQMEVVN